MSWTKCFTIAALSLFAAGAANAQNWPAKPVHLMVPVPAGTAPDIAARLMGEKMSKSWGQQLVVENRAGAGGIPGMSTFIKSAPDGYSFAMVPATVVTLTPHLFKKPQFNIDTDVTPVAIVATGPFIVAVNPTIGVNRPRGPRSSWRRSSRARSTSRRRCSTPRRTSPASCSALRPASSSTPVPYSGSGRRGDRHHDRTRASSPSTACRRSPRNIRAGKLKAIAVTSKERIPGFESLPTVRETRIQDFEGDRLVRRARAGGDVRRRWSRQDQRRDQRAIQIPEIVQRFADLGIYPSPGARSRPRPTSCRRAQALGEGP